MKNVNKKGYLLCPCYNESETLMASVMKLKKLLNSLIEKELVSKESKILLIDDGSSDNTWEQIVALHKNGSGVEGIRFSKNFGQYAALMAGYMYVKEQGDFCISLDVDLQDDISVIPEMIQHYINGSEIVLGIRNDRSKDSFLKRTTASIYYKVIDLLDTKMIKNHPDFRLLSKKALEAMSEFTDAEPYPREIVPRLGFQPKMVYFKRQERTTGETKFNYKKLIRIAVKGIVKTTNRPLLLPLFSCIIPIIGLCFNLSPTTYWLLSFGFLGIIGLYIADIKIQVYKEPRYIIWEILK